MAVGADDGVGQQQPVGARSDDRGEPFQVYLVDDALTRRDDPQSVEGALGPLEEGVALCVAGVFERFVVRLRVRAPGQVGLYGVVHDNVDR